MELVFDLTPTIRNVSKLFFDNGRCFTIESGELKMLNEALTDKVNDDELLKIKTCFTDLIYAVVYYSMGNVFKSVDEESYRQPMYNFIESYFVNDNKGLRSQLPRTVLAKLLQTDADSELSKVVLANSNTSVSECVGMFYDPIRELTNIIHDKLSRKESYQLLTFDFRLNQSCDILYLTLGEDIRTVLFRQMFPKGRYDGVEIATNGKPRHSSDIGVFNTYCLGSEERD